MILYGRLDSPFVRRVAVTLHHYGMACELNQLSVYKDKRQLRKVTPLGRVPALVLDDGEVLIDSQMIIDHLDEMAGPEHALTPARGQTRRQVLRFVADGLGLGEKSVALGTERRYRPEDKIDPKWVERLSVQITGLLEWLESAAAGTHMLGDNLTQADITVVCAMAHLEARHPDIWKPKLYPRLAGLQDRVEATPGFLAYPFRKE